MATSPAVEELMSGAGTKGAWCGHELAPDFYVPRVEPDRPTPIEAARRHSLPSAATRGSRTTLAVTSCRRSASPCTPS